MKISTKTALIASGGVVLSAAIFLAGRAWAGGAPATAPVMTYAGVLEGADGKPLTGNQIVEVRLWPSATPGTSGKQLCAAGPKTVTLDAHGRFSIALDDCVATIKAAADAWLEVLLETNGDSSSLGTTKVGAVPYALEAGHATAADTAAAATGALKKTLDKLGCGDDTRMIAGAGACKAEFRSTSSFTTCGVNGQLPQDVCTAKLPGSKLADWWQFNNDSCGANCTDFALDGGNSTNNAVIGADRAVVCCTF